LSKRAFFAIILAMVYTLEKDEKYIRKQMARAISDYKMIKPKDRVLIAVSGGKDSLCLLDLLRKRQKFSPVKFKIAAVHFNSDNRNAKVLEIYFKKNGFNYKIVKQKDPVRFKKNKSPCFKCSWERRKRLFQVADDLGCNRIALAHHMDDIIQTTLMNMCMMGQISTMSPNQKLFNGKCHIIRPLAYVPEAVLIRYSRHNKFPKLPSKCPHSDDSTRKAVAKIITKLEKISPEVRKNIFNSLKRIKKEYLL